MRTHRTTSKETDTVSPADRFDDLKAYQTNPCLFSAADIVDAEGFLGAVANGRGTLVQNLRSVLAHHDGRPADRLAAALQCVASVQQGQEVIARAPEYRLETDTAVWLAQRSKQPGGRLSRCKVRAILEDVFTPHIRAFQERLDNRNAIEHRRHWCSSQADPPEELQRLAWEVLLRVNAGHPAKTAQWRSDRFGYALERMVDDNCALLWRYDPVRHVISRYLEHQIWGVFRHNSHLAYDRAVRTGASVEYTGNDCDRSAQPPDEAPDAGDVARWVLCSALQDIAARCRSVLQQEPGLNRDHVCLFDLRLGRLLVRSTDRSPDPLPLDEVVDEMATRWKTPTTENNRADRRVELHRAEQLIIDVLVRAGILTRS